MLKTASVARALSPRSLVAALGFSAMLLPLSPSLKGQAQAAPETVVRVATTPAQVSGVTEAPVTPVTVDIGSDDSSSPEDQLKAARKEIQDLRQRLAQAEARIAVLKAREQGIAPQNGQPGATVQPPSLNNNPNRIGVSKVDPLRSESGQTVRIEGDIVRLERAPDAPGVHDGKYRTVITDGQTGRIKEIREIPLNPVDPSRQSDRLDKLEAQLQDLLKEIHSIRQQSTRPESPDVPARK